MTDKCDIRTYRSLKDIYSGFATLSEEVLQDENPLIISCESTADICITLGVLGQPLEITFSMVLTPGGQGTGKLTFSRVCAVGRRECVWTLYFDSKGDVSYSPEGSKSIYNISNRDSVQMIFVHLLALFVMKDKPEPADETPQSDTLSS